MKTSPPFFLYIPILYILCQASSNPTSPRCSHSTPDPHTNPILTHIIPVIPTAPPNLITPFIPFVPFVPSLPKAGLFVEQQQASLNDIAIKEAP